MLSRKCVRVRTRAITRTICLCKMFKYYNLYKSSYRLYYYYWCHSNTLSNIYSRDLTYLKHNQNRQKKSNCLNTIMHRLCQQICKHIQWHQKIYAEIVVLRQPVHILLFLRRDELIAISVLIRRRQQNWLTRQT